jgi:hypothetical protein
MYASLFSEPRTSDDAPQALAAAEESQGSEGLDIVIDGANVLFHRGRHERDWDALQRTVTYFVGLKIRPIVVMKSAHFQDIPPRMKGVRAHSVVATPAVDRRYGNQGGGEEDDITAALLSMHYHCPMLSNDAFQSWLGGISNRSLATWTSRLSAWQGHLNFAFVLGEFVPMPSYPKARARAMKAAMSMDRTKFTVDSRVEEEKQRAKLVHISVRRLMSEAGAASSDGDCRALTFQGGSTLWDLKSATRPSDQKRLGETAFVFSGEGHVMDGAGKLADAFSGASSNSVFLLIAGNYVSRATSFGLTDNFAARSFPIPKGCMPPSEKALSAAAAALYIFMDSDRHKTDKIIAATARIAAASMATAAPFANALQLLSQKRMLLEPHKAAIMCGLFATMTALIPSEAKSADLLCHVPRAFSWILSGSDATSPLKALCIPKLFFSKVELPEQDDDGDGLLTRPSKVPGYENSLGVLSQGEALQWAAALGKTPPSYK